MRFLDDHDVYFMTIHWLSQAGYKGVTAKEPQRQAADDHDLLATAKRLDHLFVNRHKDCGMLVFLPALTSPGLFLQVTPMVVEAVQRVRHRL